ncbi:hypothetical protein GCM10022212_00900 [Actimicrobium antarcticum]|uniref:Uncharacterized protein n=2 Tax=Actimicrobium antarcticum TaxID=1051899 RepID=A0ABP7SHH3_9BURK
MKKLSWAVKNCFVKPVAGLVCAGLAVGALALMVTPVGLPALLVLGTLLQAAVPILVGFALGAGLIHSIYANDQTNNPADQEVRPHEPDELNDPEDKTKEDELEPPLEEFEPDTKPIQPKKIVTGYPQGKHALST